MANTDISVAFVKQYESEVHIAYQQTGTILRNTVRLKNNVRGSSTIFQKVGKGTATTKVRHEQITPMNLAHSNVEVTLKDYYAGDWCDALDEIKTNIDERKVIAQSGAYALGRVTDNLIIEALGKTKTIVGDGSKAMDLDLALEIFAKANTNELPDDRNRFAIVSPLVWNQLLKIDQFAKSDYVNDLPFLKGTSSRNWMGINWIMHNALPVSGTKRSCFLYHKTAIGHAIGQDVKSDITWHGDYASHFINNMMSQGAGLIDETGVIKFDVEEAPAAASDSGTDGGSEEEGV